MAKKATLSNIPLCPSKSANKFWTIPRNHNSSNIGPSIAVNIIIPKELYNCMNVSSVNPIGTFCAPSTIYGISYKRHQKQEIPHPNKIVLTNVQTFPSFKNLFLLKVTLFFFFRMRTPHSIVSIRRMICKTYRFVISMPPSWLNIVGTAIIANVYRTNCIILYFAFIFPAPYRSAAFRSSNAYSALSFSLVHLLLHLKSKNIKTPNPGPDGQGLDVQKSYFASGSLSSIMFMRLSVHFSGAINAASFTAASCAPSQARTPPYTSPISA